MARRKKEEPETHQNRIADAAGKLFLAKGVQNTTMDELSKASGYSKATLYVYFKNKEDIVAFQTWKSMLVLRDMISDVVAEDKTLHDRFIDIGFAINGYAEQYAEYYQILMNPIQINEKEPTGDYYSRTFQVGEDINRILLNCLAEGGANGVLKDRDYQISDLFQIWGMISGLIQIAHQKQEYIRKIIGKEPDEFLREGFERLYQLLNIR